MSTGISISAAMDVPLQTRVQHWLEFYDLASRRRVALIIRHAPGLPARPLPNPEHRQARIEWIWQNYQYHFERMAWLDDDSLPCLDMLTGTEIFAEAFGCQVYRPPDNNPFAMPLVRDAVEAERLQTPTLDAPPLRLVFEMADALQRRAGPDVLFRLVDLQSPLDVAALIWEKSDFYPALLQQPQAVTALLAKIRTLLFNFLDEWFRRYGRSFVAHFPDYYMPQGVTLSVDEIGAINTRLFRQYELPDLTAFSQRYGGLGLHCCANARHQWGNFQQVPGLRLLNLISQGEVLQEAYPYFARLGAQWHYDQSPDPLDALAWLALAPPEAHLVLEFTASSRDEAIRICDLIRSQYG